MNLVMSGNLPDIHIKHLAFVRRISTRQNLIYVYKNNMEQIMIIIPPNIIENA